MISPATPADADSEACVPWTDRRALRVLGTGAALPGPAISTGELLDRTERRFGVALGRQGRAVHRRLAIETRHLCRDFGARHEAPRPGHTNPDLAADALRAALDQAGLQARDLAYLIAHTATPARLLPPNVALVADRLAFRGPYVELRQACTGFANALAIAQGLAASCDGPVAIVGSETGSVHFDPLRVAEDSGQLVNFLQMGDGAGAVVLARDRAGRGPRIENTFFGQDGVGRKPGLTMASGSDAPCVDRGILEFAHDYGAVREGGPELFIRGAAVARALGVRLDAVARVVPHQVNGRMADIVGRQLRVDARRVFVHADRVGNTGSAAMWLALAELRRESSSGALAPGDTVLALGAEATKFMFGGFSYVHA